MTDRFQPKSDTLPIRPSRFADDIQQLFGADFDPDPLFLEESWTLGIPAAAENLHHRRQGHAERERQYRAFRELDTLETLFFVEEHERMQTQATAPQSWTPTDWAPEDRITHSWIPQGWMPEGGPRQNGGPQEVESIAEPWDSMTVAHAHRLLGVTAASTREQIRSAYRRMVSEWHPDRLQYASEAVRERATQQMAAINEAYRLLCPTQQSEAA
jgi:DnaJ-domain-containing protein 1